MTSKKFIAIVSVMMFQLGSSVDPTATLSSGLLIRGSKLKSSNEQDFLAFRGIPYAQPPVGSLRFQDPLPALPWTGTLDASKEGPSCLQFDERLKDFRGTEDCLCLNVYTRNLNQEAPGRPVMVFIHGNAWSQGSGNGESDIYGPENLMDRDIVLVTINYRLSALGFLSTEDEVAPGNYGLLDQQLALEWVKNNINSFGGNSEAITIFGHSAGGSSVHLHVLSPRSKGLFHRAILQSGTALCPWGTFKYVGEYTRRMAKHFKCPTDSSVKLIECLRQQDGKELVEYRKLILVTDANPIAFGPRIDIERASPFLPKKPTEMIESGEFNHVPLIIGVTANEAGFAVARLASSKSGNGIDRFSKNPELFLSYGQSSEFDETMTNKSLAVFHNYFPNHKAGDELDLKRLEELLSDGLFFKCTMDTIDLHTKYGKEPVYSYLYNHQGLFSYTMFYAEDLPVELGVSHGDDVQILFAIPFIPPLLVPGDIDTEKTMGDLWASFALTGIPTKSDNDVEWLPADKDHMRYLKIKDGEMDLIEGDYPFKSRLANWDPIFGKSFIGNTEDTSPKRCKRVIRIYKRNGRLDTN